MKTTTIYIIAGVLVVVVLLWYFVFRKKSTTLTSDRTAWDKKVQQTYKWLISDPKEKPMLTKKAQDNGITFEQQAMADAEWYAEQDGLVKPS